MQRNISEISSSLLSLSLPFSALLSLAIPFSHSFLSLQATKHMTIYKPPNVLVIQLKRFSYGGFIGKISKPVEFEFTLNVPCTKECSENVPEKNVPGSSKVAGKNVPRGTGGSEKVPYNLTGVIVHHGTSIHSGHYVAFVKVSLPVRVSVCPFVRLSVCPCALL